LFIYLIDWYSFKYNHLFDNEQLLFYLPKCTTGELNELRFTLETNFSVSDIVRGSDEDFLYIYGNKDIEVVYSQVSRFCPILIYTKGSEGVYLRTPQIKKHYPVSVIKPVSTIGAGDNFNAGIIYGMYRHGTTKDTLPTLSEQQWDKLIHYAILFANDVCQSYDNYISNQLAEELISQTNRF
jgi:fructokinase